MIGVNRLKNIQKIRDEQINKFLEDLEKGLAAMKMTIETKNK